MSKEKITELSQRLREAAQVQDPGASACIDLVKLMLEAAKESLVGAEGDDMLREQGAARKLEKLHKELTTNPPGIRRQENNR